MRKVRTSTVRLWKTCLWFFTAVVFIATVTYIQWLCLFDDRANDFVPVHVQQSEVIIPGWESLVRNSSFALSTHIKSNNNTTLLAGQNVCWNSSPPQVLLVVCSPVQNFDHRSAIRNTWARNATRLYNISVAFIVGISEDPRVMTKVREENLLHQDLIVENFFDSKYNTSLKSTFMLKWVTRNCKNAKFLMKTVDDAFINIANLARYVGDPSRIRPKLLVGKLNKNEHVVRDSNRDRYMPQYMYSSEIYPDYLSEAGYLMTMETAQQLYRKALTTSFVYLEDVFITGLCAEAAHVTRYYDFRFYYVEHGDYKMDCDVLYQRELIVHSYGLETATLYTDYEEFKKCNEDTGNELWSSSSSLSTTDTTNRIGWYPCPNDCGKTYKHKGSMKFHLKYECGKEPQFQCFVCGKRFSQRGSMKSHLGTHHMRDLECPNRCGKVYQTKPGLLLHLKYQCGKAPQFTCEVCSKKFKRPDSLKTHLGLVHHIVK